MQNCGFINKTCIWRDVTCFVCFQSNVRRTNRTPFLVLTNIQRVAQLVRLEKNFWRSFYDVNYHNAEIIYTHQNQASTFLTILKFLTVSLTAWNWLIHTLYGPDPLLQGNQANHLSNDVAGSTY